MAAQPRPWFNLFGGTYQGDHPGYYPEKDLPWIKILEDNYQTIREEALTILEHQQINPYPSDIVFPPRSWKTMGIIFWNIIFKNNYKQCPNTVQILSTIPNVVSYSLSILEPGTTIKPHVGDTDAIARCHLGLVIPGSLPECGFRVLDEERSWEEGKVIPFCDAREHSAWNLCDSMRLIMIIDVIHPQFADQTNDICARVMADLLIDKVKLRFPVLKRLKFMDKLWFWMFYLLVRGIIRFQSLWVK